MSSVNAVKKEAVIFRMVTAQKMCVHGLKAKDLLRRKGYHVTDKHLTCPEEIAAFKAQHGVQTVPQIFIKLFLKYSLMTYELGDLTICNIFLVLEIAGKTKRLTRP